MAIHTTYGEYLNANRSLLTARACSLFEYGSNIPPELDRINWRVFDRDLMLKDKAAAFWEPRFNAFINTAITANGNLDINGIPTDFELTAIGYNRKMSADKVAFAFNSQYDSGDGKNTTGYFNLSGLIEIYAKRLADIDIGIRNEINNAKHPAVISVSDKKYVKSAKEAWRQADDGSPIVIVDKDLFESGGKMGVFPLPTETHLEDKLAARAATINEFLGEILGVDSLKYEKTERLITAEADSNKEAICLALQNLLIPRLEFCKRFERLYGYKVWCRPRTLNVKEIYGNADNDSGSNH